MKNFALMGACSSGKGKLTVTDDDVIEKSNLSRQFLFRDKDIGRCSTWQTLPHLLPHCRQADIILTTDLYSTCSAKSTCATEAAKAINPSLKVDALQNRVSPETEDVFNDGFWSETDLIVNALDNVNARLYVDARCVYFCKPLLESGTLGKHSTSFPAWTNLFALMIQ